jgi:hypothetical protein
MKIYKPTVKFLWVLEGISTRQFFFSYLQMETTNLRFEYQLDGASNFLSWKERVILFFKEHDLWKIVENFVPIERNATQNVCHEKDIKS